MVCCQFITTEKTENHRENKTESKGINAVRQTERLAESDFTFFGYVGRWHPGPACWKMAL
jgi:hypothetical protein